MALLLQHSRTLLLHVPKTGGCWIEVALQAANVPFTRVHPPGTRPHQRHWQWTPWELREIDCDFRAAFVRHPLTWYESYWKWRNSPGKERVYWPGNPCDAGGLPARGTEFHLWLANLLEREPSYCTRLTEQYVGPESSPYSNAGRYESLADDLLRMLRVCGEPLTESQGRTIRKHPRYNVSRPDSGAPVWTEDLKQMVLRQDAPLIRRYYDEGSPA